VPKQLTLDAAERIVAACKARADELGQPMNIAVMDGGAHLVAFVAMDGTLLAGNEIAQRKAWTAVAMRAVTRDLTPMVQPGAPIYGIEPVSGGMVVPFGGGIPLLDEEGRVVGGVGVSAGSPEQDHDVAAAGVAAF